MLGALAPWAMAGGILVSFVASAGQDGGGSSLVERSEPRPTAEPPASATVISLASAFRLPGLSLGDIVGEAALSFEAPREASPAEAWLAPRDDLKIGAAAFPDINREQKSDPWPPLRPTISAQVAPSPLGSSAELNQIIFGPAGEGVVSEGFTPQGTTLARLGPGFFEPPALEPPAAEPAPVDLASVDPGQAIEAPQAQGPLGPGAPWTTTAPKDRPSDRPAPSSRFAHLVGKDKEAEFREMRCLAEAVYFEARSEPERGQVAVAQVVLNRVLHPNYPDTICGVVYQNRHRHLACQFTFACEGRALRINEPDAWRQAVQIATNVVSGSSYLSDVGASTHYHADYVRPRWARALTRMDTIGRHTFYKLKPGQS